MKKIYLAGPNTGIPNDNEAQFRFYQAKLENDGNEVVVPHDLFDEEEKATFKHKDFMRKCIPAMMGCDEVVTLDGWIESKGATEEVQIARMYDIPVTPVSRAVNVKYHEAIPQH